MNSPYCNNLLIFLSKRTHGLEIEGSFAFGNLNLRREVKMCERSIEKEPWKLGLECQTFSSNTPTHTKPYTFYYNLVHEMGLWTDGGENFSYLKSSDILECSYLFLKMRKEIIPEKGGE